MLGKKASGLVGDEERWWGRGRGASLSVCVCLFEASQQQSYFLPICCQKGKEKENLEYQTTEESKTGATQSV